MNPPFGGRNAHVPWLRKFLAHGNGVAIVRAYTSSGWFHEWAIQAETMLFPRGKTRFIRPARSAPRLDTALFCSGWATSPTPHSKAVAWVSSFASQDCHKLGAAHVRAAAGTAEMSITPTKAQRGEADLSLDINFLRALISLGSYTHVNLPAVHRRDHSRRATTEEIRHTLRAQADRTGKSAIPFNLHLRQVA